MKQKELVSGKYRSEKARCLQRRDPKHSKHLAAEEDSGLPFGFGGFFLHF